MKTTLFFKVWAWCRTPLCILATLLIPIMVSSSPEIIHHHSEPLLSGKMQIIVGFSALFILFILAAISGTKYIYKLPKVNIPDVIKEGSLNFVFFSIFDNEDRGNIIRIEEVGTVQSHKEIEQKLIKELKKFKGSKTLEAAISSGVIHIKPLSDVVRECRIETEDFTPNETFELIEKILSENLPKDIVYSYKREGQNPNRQASAT